MAPPRINTERTPDRDETRVDTSDKATGEKRAEKKAAAKKALTPTDQRTEAVKKVAEHMTDVPLSSGRGEPLREKTGAGAKAIGAPKLLVKTEKPRPVLVQPKLVVESIAGKSTAPPDLKELRAVMQKYYGDDILKHPNFTYYESGMDLSKVPHERFSDVDPLKEVVLVAPVGLGAEWKDSPIAAVRTEGVDVPAAMRDHALLTKYYLDHGIKVHFVVMPEAASQAVFATDVVTTIGKLVVISNPLHWERGLETTPYKGAVKMADYDPLAPIEWGDLQLAHHNGKMLVLQGVGSMRSNDASVAALGAMLKDKAADIGSPYEHIPVRLKQISTAQAVGTLHLDYVVGVIGSGKDRALIVVPDALENPDAQIKMLTEKLGISPDRIIIADRQQMAYGATNLEQIDEKTILYSDHPVLAPVAAQMEKLGFKVDKLPMKDLAVVDGNGHCVTGQLRRARPPGMAPAPVTN